MMVFADTTGGQAYDDGDFVDTDTFILNESLPITSSIDTVNSTNTPLSLILEVLSTTTSEINNNTENKSITLALSQTTVTVTPVSSLIDQFNYYRNIEILSRIKQCDPNMKLNEMCETYSIANDTNALKHQSNIEFQTLKHLSDSLVERMTVEKLNKLCPPAHWCLANLTQDDIRFITDVIRQRGGSFCSLEQCYPRLIIHMDSCPLLSNKNISLPTLKLFPMLCSLYNEQQSWNSTQCIEGIMYLIHIFYAFWPELETCHHDIVNGSDSCRAECQTFDTIFHQVENQCDGNASFLSQVPSMAWYQSIDLQQICQQKSIIKRPLFIYSMEKFFSSNTFWYRFHQKSVYTASVIFIVISLVISLLLCFYIKSKRKSSLNRRRFDDDYEYTRLHNTSFELATNTEIPNMNSSSDGMIDESQLDSNDHHRLSEYQRLLNVEL